MHLSDSACSLPLTASFCPIFGLLNGAVCVMNENSMAGAIILAIAFGIEVKSEGDPHVETAEKGLGAVLLGTMPQAAMYDFFPIRMFSLQF